MVKQFEVWVLRGRKKKITCTGPSRYDPEYGPTGGRESGVRTVTTSPGFRPRSGLLLDSTRGSRVGEREVLLDHKTPVY